ncbi:MAG: peroxiredoxin [Deltaproteobacteria bacterium HGW-Deltaproteobacteria-19]|jgi:putative redox protein|nr:MAG: peroxiredoxin [Deltaproteobacteria bacterium HGW-Deltaproteobacteria-19]
MAEQEKADLEPTVEGYKNFVAPPVKTTLVWNRDLQFTGSTPKGYDIDFDANAQWGCMPMEALLLSLAGCMAIDIVMILKKMRVRLAGFRMELTAERNPTPPQYFKAVEMVLHLAGKDIDPRKVDRAVALSHSTYCSVYNSLRKDMTVTVRTVIEDRDPEGEPV